MAEWKDQTVQERRQFAAVSEEKEIYDALKTGKQGIATEDVDEIRDTYGKNEVIKGNPVSLYRRIGDAFINPFTVILIFLAALSWVTDVYMADSGDEDITSIVIITTMVLISGILRFVQESRSGNAVAKLSDMIKTTAAVKRQGMGAQEIALEEIVVGDRVQLAAGDMIPADMKICRAKDLFVSQSTLTGESEPVEKYSRSGIAEDTVTDNPNLAFMGSSVISGSAAGIVIAVGRDTLLGEIAKSLTVKPPKTSFEKGVNDVSWVLIRFMLVMVPIVLVLNGFTKGDWMHAALFAISIAVGLTPEMLPMIVTTCLAKGAVTMSRKQVIIKNLNAIQNLGSMDVLCTDKTGTLTMDKVVLEYHLDIQGNENIRVLRHAFLNSYYQTGLRNLMDLAVLERMGIEQDKLGASPNWKALYQKVDEVPFDFERRCMSVVVADGNGKTQMITKGAVEEMLKISSFVEYGNQVVPLDEKMRSTVLEAAYKLNRQGLRVIAVAQKNDPSPVGAFSVADEKNLVLIGYLAFLDPPKESAAAAIRVLREKGVTVKILTGDSERVAACVCQKVGVPTERVVLGHEIETMDDDQLAVVSAQTSLFAKLSPDQKARVVRLLRQNGSVVGFMGDGINDAAAMKAADVGISVDTAVDIAKESADVILLKKDLMVLEAGVIEGRRTYANMIKYIKMTSSSNFGNMFSVLAASAFLPFLPMESLQLILLNLIYDLSCTAVPWDNVDEEFIEIPRKWKANSISRFMLWFGPTSSIFDIITYLGMYFVICPAVFGGQLFSTMTDPAMKMGYVALFQTGWFVESMWTQTLVIHMIRTPKIPFFQSRASWPVILLTFTGIIVLTTLPATALRADLGLHALPAVYFAFLGAIVLSYMVLVTLVKNAYIKQYGELL